MNYNVEDLVTINKKSNYYREPVVAVPCNGDKYYIFSTGEYVSAKDYERCSRVVVEPITIIKNEHRMNESKEYYNFSPLSEEEIAIIEKALGDQRNDETKPTFDCSELYVLQGMLDGKKHICFEVDGEKFYDILEDKPATTDEYNFVGRLDMLRIKFGRLYSGLFYLDKKDIKILQDKINDQKHLVENKNLENLEM